MLIAMVVFGSQDALSKLLALDNNPVFITIIRYWAFTAFVLIMSAGVPGGIRQVAQTVHLPIQILRGVMLVVQICLIVYSFVKLGLVETHAVFAVYPLMLAALSAFVLKERTDRWQWMFIGLGFCGVLIILRPGTGVFDPWALIPLGCAGMYAVYGVLTRIASRDDGGSTSFFYLGLAGAAAITLCAPFVWGSLQGWEWLWMALLSITGAASHYALIKAFEYSEPATLQPFAYLQGVFAAFAGVVIFKETFDLPLLIGASVVIFSGVLCLNRVRRNQQMEKRDAA